MTIETKYNIGDEVWFMWFNKPIKGIVVKIDIDIAKTGDWYIEHYKVGVDGVDITPDTKGYFVHPLGLPSMKFTVNHSELFVTRKEVEIDKKCVGNCSSRDNELFDLSPVYDDIVSSK